MRDMLVHGFSCRGLSVVDLHEAGFGVDVDLVWDVVETKIPPLRAAVRRLLDDPELT